MSDNQTRPLSDLIGGLFGDLSGLFRKEIQLAKAEASEKLTQTLGGVQLLVAGAVLALGALGVFLSALVTLIAAFLVARGMGATLASSVAAGLVTIVVGLIAWSLVTKGLHTLKASNLKMDRTVSSLAHDADVVKERL